VSIKYIPYTVNLRYYWGEGDREREGGERESKKLNKGKIKVQN
jgi:hypothetical protein